MHNRVARSAGTKEVGFPDQMVEISCCCHPAYHRSLPCYISQISFLEKHPACVRLIRHGSFDSNDTRFRPPWRFWRKRFHVMQIIFLFNLDYLLLLRLHLLLWRLLLSVKLAPSFLSCPLVPAMFLRSLLPLRLWDLPAKKELFIKTHGLFLRIFWSCFDSRQVSTFESGQNFEEKNVTYVERWVFRAVL
jgi:hypothetical protein